jgi:hypothetical protein
MSKHTPGPWEWRDGDELREGRITVDGGRYGAVVLAAYHDYDRGPYLEAADGNRHLIAAAPEMFEELIRSTGLLERELDALPLEANYGRETLIAQIARNNAALAKARGES